jgi:hypothetical protein
MVCLEATPHAPPTQNAGPPAEPCPDLFLGVTSLQL